VAPPPFTSIRHPVGIDLPRAAVTAETDYATHVDQLIRQVLLTDPGERVNRPDFGCGIRRMLFAPNNPVAATLAQVTIVEALQRWLSTVIDVNDVIVRSVEETVEITVAYTLRARGERRYLNLEVTL
jgi:phage baseplate assembly protein W